MNFKKLFSCKIGSSNRYYLLKREYKRQKEEIEDLKEQNNILQSQMSTIDFNMYEEFENIKQENSILVTSTNQNEITEKTTKEC